MIRDPINVRTINQARSVWPVNSVVNVGAGSAGPSFPANLAGAIGVYDVSVLSSMTIGRDGSGGTPGIGDVVGTLADLSPAGNDLVAPSDAARPVLRQTVGGLYYLEHDGVDDVLQSAVFASGGPVPIYLGVSFVKLNQDFLQMFALWEAPTEIFAVVNIGNVERLNGFMRTAEDGINIKLNTHLAGTSPVNVPQVVDMDLTALELTSRVNGGDERTVDLHADPLVEFSGYTNTKITTAAQSTQYNFYAAVLRAGTANAGTDAADIRQWLADRSGATLV